ncbi:hypothetical protein ACQ4LE_005607 [Meloidogyne hapla]|uniref:Homeobox domain-containing protein n=1 Tax=Meloidogyne hapla TaxID=6305 RepID=A0A1I8B5H0_MELHA
MAQPPPYGQPLGQPVGQPQYCCLPMPVIQQLSNYFSSVARPNINNTTTIPQNDVASKILKMHDDHMDEVKTLKNEIKQKNEEINSLKKQLNTSNSYQLFLEQMIIKEQNKNEEIKGEFVEVLENHYKYYKNPSDQEKSILANCINVSVDKVDKWFEKKRQLESVKYQKIEEDSEIDSELNDFDHFDDENEKEEDNDKTGKNKEK